MATQKLKDRNYGWLGSIARVMTREIKLVLRDEAVIIFFFFKICINIFFIIFKIYVMIFGLILLNIFLIFI